MYQFKIEGMTCGSYVCRVTRAIHTMDSSANVLPDVRSRTVRVQTTVKAEQLQQALDHAGYPSTTVS